MLTVSLLLPPKSGTCPSPRSAWSRAAGRRAARRTTPGSRAPRRRCPRARRCWPWRRRRRAAAAAAGRRRPADREARQRASAARSTNGEQAAQVWESVAGDAEEALRRASARAWPRRNRPPACSSRWRTTSSRRRGPPTSRRCERRGQKDGDVVGYIVAINGKLGVANVYPSNGLFRKMWEKQLAAVVTEAIGEKAGAARRRCPPPAPAAATEFLDAGREGQAAGARERPPACARRRATPTSRSTTRRAAPTANGSTAATSRSSAEFQDPRIPGPSRRPLVRRGGEAGAFAIGAALMKVDAGGTDVGEPHRCTTSRGLIENWGKSTEPFSWPPAPSNVSDYRGCVPNMD